MVHKDIAGRFYNSMPGCGVLFCILRYLQMLWCGNPACFQIEGNRCPFCLLSRVDFFWMLRLIPIFE